MEFPTPQAAKEIEQFLQKLEDYPPPIPDSVIKQILSECGMHTNDIRVSHIMNVVCQKFMSDVMTKCCECAKLRAKEDKKKKKLDIQVSDLKAALETRGIHVNRPEFIVSIEPDEKEKEE
ncbi:hypothetical protein TVAG_121360 [Trichomonas vaginalis G3]|uniref:Transcription initiation factor TFIID subunit 10 n=1 Tax=Trichomonas vaginalis (strain ATCC PRA-98 / G3) TaxID=412133 RepID=A2G0V6_TRIV3|nr:DNA-templated transcription, initiation [Trichomonas vaginalis G3]EAX89202.1 hypothetical protein TVAG_121360 [Trichomonas vaginalis G3]KAI5551342.1 DNA-templated transcription, initiation [Trichomonas vaginalis G3]|eukprot:XP_001302132.1 hypothetical protein [Trichomonas vaginalis G3]